MKRIDKREWPAVESESIKSSPLQKEQKQDIQKKPLDVQSVPKLLTHTRSRPPLKIMEIYNSTFFSKESLSREVIERIRQTAKTTLLKFNLSPEKRKWYLAVMERVISKSVSSSLHESIEEEKETEVDCTKR